MKTYKEFRKSIGFPLKERKAAEAEGGGEEGGEEEY